MVTVDGRSDLEVSLTELAALSLTATPLAETLTTITALAVRAIPGADGAGLALASPDGPAVIAASDDFVRVVDAIQFRLEEGPTLLAVRHGSVQVSGSLGGESRWPHFGPAAGRLGLHSVLSLPLLADGQVIGALNAYGRLHRAFDEDSVRSGERFATPAAVSAANAAELEHSRQLAEQLRQAMISRPTIDQAIGILMSRRGCDEHEAFEILRRSSQGSSTKVVEVARRLVQEAVQRARVLHAPEPPDELDDPSRSGP